MNGAFAGFIISSKQASLCLKSLCQGNERAVGELPYLTISCHSFQRLQDVTNHQKTTSAL